MRDHLRSAHGYEILDISSFRLCFVRLFIACNFKERRNEAASSAIAHERATYEFLFSFGWWVMTELLVILPIRTKEKNEEEKITDHSHWWWSDRIKTVKISYGFGQRYFFCSTHFFFRRCVLFFSLVLKRSYELRRNKKFPYSKNNVT